MNIQQRSKPRRWPIKRTERPRVAGDHPAAERGAWPRRIVSATLWVIIIAIAVVFWPAKLGGSFSIIIVAGDSMEPTMSIGDVALTWKKSNPEVGDVLVYRVPDGGAGAGISVIHRVISVEDGVWHTQGDNRSFPDHWDIRAEDIIGVTRTVIPGLGRLFVGPFLAVLIGGIMGFGALMLFWPDEDEDEEREEDPVPSGDALEQGERIAGVELVTEAEDSGDVEEAVGEQTSTRRLRPRNRH